MRAIGKIAPKYNGELSFVNINIDPTENDDSIEKFKQSIGNEGEFAKFQTTIVLDYGVTQRSTMITIDSSGIIRNREIYQNNTDIEWRDIFEALIVQ